MYKKKIMILSGIIAIILIVVSSCSKTATLLEDKSASITTTVSFSKDVAPILTANCAKSGCHNGSISPNLSSGSAYTSLTNGFVSTASPSSSLVYLWLTGKESVTMPLGGTNNPSNINGYILAWITQGAKNN